MLIMRPNCECCGAGLAADSPDARICSFECTFCRTCTDGELQGTCPNCGGDLVPRPTRASELWERYPPSTERRVRGDGCTTAPAP